MSTWGINNFENDIAVDWANMITEADDAELVIIALKEIDNEEDYIEAPECMEALCAIEIIAGFKTKSVEFLPLELGEWTEKLASFIFDENTYVLAKRVLERIITDSELFELWEDSDFFEEWLEIQNRLLASFN